MQAEAAFRYFEELMDSINKETEDHGNNNINFPKEVNIDEIIKTEQSFSFALEETLKLTNKVLELEMFKKMEALNLGNLNTKYNPFVAEDVQTAKIKRLKAKLIIIRDKFNIAYELSKAEVAKLNEIQKKETPDIEKIKTLTENYNQSDSFKKYKEALTECRQPKYDTLKGTSKEINISNTLRSISKLHDELTNSKGAFDYKGMSKQILEAKSAPKERIAQGYSLEKSLTEFIKANEPENEPEVL